MFSQTRIMELPGLLGLLGITRFTLELLSKSGITELLAQIPSNSGLVTSLTRCWKPLGSLIITFFNIILVLTEMTKLVVCKNWNSGTLLLTIVLTDFGSEDNFISRSNFNHEIRNRRAVQNYYLCLYLNDPPLSNFKAHL